MRGVRNTERGIEVLEVPDPDGDGVTVRVRSSGICGSDLHMLAYGPLPVTLGHEFAGTLDDGTAVAVDPSVPCGACDQCESGASHRCRTGTDRLLGVGADGGMADAVRVAPSALVPLGSVDPGDACLVEPLAVAVHGCRIAAVGAETRVAVVGAGAIGLAAVAATGAHAGEVGLAARYDHQRTAGERLGATALTTEYDVVVDAAGTEASLAQAAELCRPGGTVLFLSTHWTPVDIPGLPAMMKELDFRWSYTYGTDDDSQRDVDAAATLLASTPAIADTMITHRFALDDAAEAFRVAADRSEGVIKVVLEP
jgi:threonine dehydrogenase-like Zn-dependent dehydrogenase